MENLLTMVSLQEASNKGLTKGFGGNNFVTPTILGFLGKEGFVIELSTGNMRPISNNTVFGVTVAIDGKIDSSKSKMCHSRAEAHEYIGELLK